MSLSFLPDSSYVFACNTYAYAVFYRYKPVFHLFGKAVHTATRCGVQNGSN